VKVAYCFAKDSIFKANISKLHTPYTKKYSIKNFSCKNIGIIARIFTYDTIFCSFYVRIK
ncbi:hypothetical protein, partial [Helicobacter bilis]|uniref:hypothetical protein n=1 Tax=Helicobacter bilis TaxID=37372 RepID=UPI0026EF6C03